MLCSALTSSPLLVRSQQLLTHKRQQRGWATIRTPNDEHVNTVGSDILHQPPQQEEAKESLFSSPSGVGTVSFPLLMTFWSRTTCVIS